LSKNWIGNERKRKGLASKRAPRDPTNTLKYVLGQKRKKSSYSVFKSTYLSSETARKVLAEGHGPGDIQKQANLAYRQLTCEEKEEFRKTADEENCADPSNTRIPRQRLVKKIVANIHANARHRWLKGHRMLRLMWKKTVSEKGRKRPENQVHRIIQRYNLLPVRHRVRHLRKNQRY